MTDEPTSAVVVATGQVIRQGARVWVHDSNASTIVVEHRSKIYRLPLESVRAAPVPAPTEEALINSDACFGKREQLELVERNRERMFSLYRCPHGRLFLDDVRGGIAMYSRLILVAPEHAQLCPEAIWTHYHAIPDDILNHWNIAR